MVAAESSVASGPRHRRPGATLIWIILTAESVLRMQRRPSRAQAAAGVNASEMQNWSSSPCAMKAGTAASTICTEPQA
jgi:hypothetical protein